MTCNNSKRISFTLRYSHSLQISVVRNIITTSKLHILLFAVLCSPSDFPFALAYCWTDHYLTFSIAKALFSARDRDSGWSHAKNSLIFFVFLEITVFLFFFIFFISCSFSFFSCNHFHINGHRRTRRGAPSPRAWKFSGQTQFSGQAQVAQKSWMIKYISIQWKIPGQLCFQGKRKLLKNPECKKYIQYSEFMATLFFRASASCSKILNGKKYIQCSEKFQGNSVFSGQAQVAQKSWAVKRFSIQCAFTWVWSV